MNDENAGFHQAIYAQKTQEEAKTCICFFLRIR